MNIVQPLAGERNSIMSNDTDETGVIPPCKNECYINEHEPEGQCAEEHKGYVCSRKRGHKGQHVACGSEHAYLVWWRHNR